jgi:hypothetical protein
MIRYCTFQPRSAHHTAQGWSGKTTTNLPASEIHNLSDATPLPADTHTIDETLVQLVVRHALDSGAYAEGVASTLRKLLPSFRSLSLSHFLRPMTGARRHGWRTSLRSQSRRCLT